MSASISVLRPALVLFAHGARDPDWAKPIWRVKESILAARAGARVEVAFLEFMSPDLGAASGKLIVEGADSVTVVPLFIAQGGHLKQELPLMLDALRAQYPAVVFNLAPPVGESDAVSAAMAVQAMISSGI